MGELVGQQRHEYDSEKRGIEIRTPLKEIGGKVYKGGRKSDDHHSGGQKLPPSKGGHFAAFEQPALFVYEVRSFFRLVR